MKKIITIDNILKLFENLKVTDTIFVDDYTWKTLKAAIKKPNGKIIQLCVKKVTESQDTYETRCNTSINIKGKSKEILEHLVIKSKAKNIYRVNDFQKNCVKYFSLNNPAFQTALETYFNNWTNSQSGGEKS